MYFAVGSRPTAWDAAHRGRWTKRELGALGREAAFLRRRYDYAGALNSGLKPRADDKRLCIWENRQTTARDGCR